ncbi:hypothetical protein SLEP1_g30278 [Rubroshorea leprosula]|uniref:Uncharacterized protein n=1 Tax=Rubroshorea leprosula TaxID=152421 RepID=A0AAV5K9K7_9ROSI|nr:hypothetical protein SLEP1_g30278 [Rubroshorea leprosula]
MSDLVMDRGDFDGADQNKNEKSSENGMMIGDEREVREGKWGQNMLGFAECEDIECFLD